LKVAQLETLDDDKIEDADLEHAMISVTEDDITYLQAAILESEQCRTGKTPIPCDQLGDPPRPSDIADIFSSVLGDIFHAMDRPKVPVKHASKKGYFVALQNAFFIWDEDQMAELRERMAKAGKTDEEIDSELYYNSKLFRGCVARRVPPPSILYWRVRAVFALYGNIVDSDSKKPLFNSRAWAKARNVLNEIRAGLYSDPPGFEMYTYKLDKNGEVKKNKYGMKMIDSIRGTNRTEAYHKGLVTTFGSWICGIEMSDCLLAERRHRHNQRVSEIRRLDFPILGHFDTWRVDAIQNLVWKNHRIQIYPGWTNASDYKDTEESFDTVALHSQPLHDALEERMKEIDASSVKLSRENKYLADSVGAKLPFLPFISDEENVLYAHCVLDGNFPLDDDEKAAIAWCKHVDGVKIMPKLPVHMRTHREAFKRNQRVRDSVARAEKGQSALDKLNEVIKSAKPSTPAVAMPAALPTLGSEAADRSSNKVVADVVTGDLPESEAKQQNSGKRGPDKKHRKSCQGFTKRCKLCTQWAPDHMMECTGRGGLAKCDLFDSDGSQRCGPCTRAYLKDEAVKKLRVCMLKLVSLQLVMSSFDPNCCEHYSVGRSNRVKRKN